MHGMGQRQIGTGFVLGTGSLNWGRGERITDRYGAIVLYNQDGTDSPGQYSDERIASLVGKTGTLSAKVLEPHKSDHIGDLFRGLAPSLPDKGETHVLGHGTLFTEDVDWLEKPSLGVRPLDGREDDWMDPKALYRLHKSTVELVFAPDDDRS